VAYKGDCRGPWTRRFHCSIQAPTTK